MKEVEDRYSLIKEKLLLCSSALLEIKKQYKAISSHFTDLCEEKLRLETILFEQQGKVKKISSIKNKEKPDKTEEELRVKKEYDELQKLLVKHGLAK